jgi:hypothetical protein
MNKTNAKKIIKEKFGIIVKGKTQLNSHGCGEYSLQYGENLEKQVWFRNY